MVLAPSTLPGELQFCRPAFLSRFLLVERKGEEVRIHLKEDGDSWHIKEGSLSLRLSGETTVEELVDRLVGREGLESNSLRHLHDSSHRKKISTPHPRRIKDKRSSEVGCLGERFRER